MARLRLSHLLAAFAVLVPVSLAQNPDDQDQPYFMGWYFAPDSTEAINCATDEVWSTMQGDRSYGACCPSEGDCRIATDCYGTTVLYNDNSTQECTSGNYCMSFSILRSYPSGDPTVVQLWCNTYWRAHTVYRELPSETSSLTAQAVRTVTVTTTATPQSCPTNPGPVETGASDDEGDDVPAGASASKAWVAGAVIGPVAAVALIGLAFWYGRRRALRNRDGGLGGTGSGSGPGAAAPGGGEGAGGGVPTSHPLMSSWHQSMHPGAAAAAAPGTYSPYYNPQSGANQYAPVNQNHFQQQLSPQHPYPHQSPSQEPYSATVSVPGGSTFYSPATYNAYPKAAEMGSPPTSTITHHHTGTSSSPASGEPSSAYSPGNVPPI